MEQAKRRFNVDYSNEYEADSAEEAARLFQADIASGVTLDVLEMTKPFDVTEIKLPPLNVPGS